MRAHVRQGRETVAMFFKIFSWGALFTSLCFRAGGRCITEARREGMCCRDGLTGRVLPRLPGGLRPSRPKAADHSFLSYYSTTLLHYYSTSLLFHYSSTPLIYYSSTRLLLYSPTLLLSYSSTLLQAESSRPLAGGGHAAKHGAVGDGHGLGRPASPVRADKHTIF